MREYSINFLLDIWAENDQLALNEAFEILQVNPTAAEIQVQAKDE